MDLLNKLLTWDNLLKHRWIGPSRCVLCFNKEENTHHIFMDCSFTSSVWSKLCGIYKCESPLSRNSFAEMFKLWLSNFVEHSFSRYLFFFAYWSIWKSRNHCIFEGVQASVSGVIYQISHLMHYYLVPKQKVKIR